MGKEAWVVHPGGEKTNWRTSVCVYSLKSADCGGQPTFFLLPFQSMSRNSYKKLHKTVMMGWSVFWHQILSMAFSPSFIILTLLGNTFVFLNGILFYYVEKDVNGNLQGVLDGIWWAVATVTTVGYGDIVPVTTLGKVHGIFMMLSGTAIFLAFTALFAQAVIGAEIDDVESEVRKVEREIRKIQK